MDDDDVGQVLNDLDANGESGTIGPRGGALLGWFVGLLGARRVLEIGTSDGYAAIWLARALRETNGTLVTLERDPDKAERARANLERVGLRDRVIVVEGAALMSLAALGGEFDLVFIDASKERYSEYLEAVRGLVRNGSVIVADNLTSHAEATTAYRAAIAEAGWPSIDLPVSGGFLLTRVVGIDAG